MNQWLRFMTLLCALAVGCASQAAPHADEDAWLAAITQVHAQVDKSSDRAGAHTLLVQALQREVPARIAPEDRRRVVQDLYFRSALLSLELAEPARAAQECELGIALGDAPDEFTANLWIARGRAEAKLGRAGDAAKAYARAMTIHEHLMNVALEGAP